MPVRYAPRRRPPPPACPAWNFAYIGTVQPAVGQSLGRAAQIQRLPTPSRALCLETHQTRPYPRNHRYGRVRTWSRLQSGRTITGKLAFHAHPPTPGAAGRHSLKMCAAPETKRPSLQIAATAVRCLPKLETGGTHVPPSAHGVRIPARCARTGLDGGPRAVACCLGAVRSTFRPGGRQPGAGSIHRPQAVVIPRLRHLGWPRMRGVAPVRSHYARIAGVPAGHATKPASPTPCGGPGDGRWVPGRRPCLGRRQMGSRLVGTLQVVLFKLNLLIKNPGSQNHRNPGAVVSLRSGRAYLASGGACGCNGRRIFGRSLPLALQRQWPQCRRSPSPAARLFGVTGLSTRARTRADGPHRPRLRL
jgi:hypothetical protein